MQCLLPCSLYNHLFNRWAFRCTGSKRAVWQACFQSCYPVHSSFLSFECSRMFFAGVRRCSNARIRWHLGSQSALLIRFIFSMTMRLWEAENLHRQGLYLTVASGEQISSAMVSDKHHLISAATASWLPKRQQCLFLIFCGALVVYVLLEGCEQMCILFLSQWFP